LPCIAASIDAEFERPVSRRSPRVARALPTGHNPSLANDRSQQCHKRVWLSMLVSG